MSRIDYMRNSISVGKIIMLGLLVSFLILLWQTVPPAIGISPEKLPTPTATYRALIDGLRSGILWTDVKFSLWRISVGFLVAVPVGVMLGIIAAIFPRLGQLWLFVIESIRPIPPIAWIPLAILWFGIGNKPAFFIVFLGAVFPIYSSTLTAVQEIEKTYVDAARTLGAGTLSTFRHVIFPCSLPYMLSGFRTGMGFAWMCVVTAEMVGAQNGLGYNIQLNRSMVQTDYVIAGMIAIGVVGILLNGFMHLCQILLVPWQHGRTLRK